ncbi:MAG: hypothetical protein Kow0090_06450 [Myxococcota bacterium]
MGYPNKTIAIFLACMSLAFIACGDGGWSKKSKNTCLRPELCAADEDSSADRNGGDEEREEEHGEGDWEEYECGEGTWNRYGIGEPCTKGGGECKRGLSCDMDLDEAGIGICVKLFCKSNDECGDFAICCKPEESPINVCINDECLPPECGGQFESELEGADSGSTDEDSDAGEEESHDAFAEDDNGE